jgi:enterochelin esterase-like enzyme
MSLQKYLVATGFAWFVLGTAGAAAAADSAVTPASSNVRGASSPGIHSDGSITFTLKAPDVRRVRLEGGDGLGTGPFPMTRGARGTWSVTIKPAAAGFHYYWFTVDGVAVNDAGSETYFGYDKATSGIEVPDALGDFYAIHDVPHGEVRARWYHSKVTGTWRRVFIYTPPGYDRDIRTRYPMLILQHGAGEDETGWTRQGRAQFILDNLIASGQAKPMILVMDCGYAALPGKPVLTFTPQTPSADVLAAFRTFEDVIVEDVIPLIDASYRTLADREHRAMAGLSMGGMETLFITLQHPEKFSYIGSFSGPFLAGLNTGSSDAKFDPKKAYEGALADPKAFNQRFKLLWLGAGTAESQFRPGISAAARALQKSGVHMVYFESTGTAHEWQTWRRDLRDFVPRLF